MPSPEAGEWSSVVNRPVLQREWRQNNNLDSTQYQDVPLSWMILFIIPGCPDESRWNYYSLGTRLTVCIFSYPSLVSFFMFPYVVQYVLMAYIISYVETQLLWFLKQSPIHLVLKVTCRTTVCHWIALLYGWTKRPWEALCPRLQIRYNWGRGKHGASDSLEEEGIFIHEVSTPSDLRELVVRQLRTHWHWPEVSRQEAHYSAKSLVASDSGSRRYVWDANLQRICCIGIWGNSSVVD